MKDLRPLGAASAAALMLAMAAGAQQQDLSAVVITSVDMGDGMHMLIGQGGNIGASIGPDGVLIVDDQFAPLTERILTKIEELGGTDGVRFVINTHHHGDHSGGNDNLRAQGATVVAHDNVRKRMGLESVSPNGTVNPPRPPEAWPVITFADSATFHMNGQTIAVMHVAPAHTDGDSLIHFQEANIVHMGDTMSWGSFPRADVGGGGSVDGFVGAYDLALSLANDETRVIPGHGTAVPLTKADLQSYRDMVAAALAIVVPLAQGDQSIDDIVAAAPLAAVSEQYGIPAQNTEAYIRGVVTALRPAPATP